MTSQTHSCQTRQTHKPTTLSSGRPVQWNVNVPETRILVHAPYSHPTSGCEPESMISSRCQPFAENRSNTGRKNEDDTLSSNGLRVENSSRISGLAGDWLIGWFEWDLDLGAGEIIHTWLRMVRISSCTNIYFVYI